MPLTAGKRAEPYLQDVLPSRAGPLRSEPPYEQGCGTRHWYAVYTTPRHEKSVARHLESRSLECFLPLYRTIRNWQHRHATFELPLFPCYLFVNIALQERMNVLTSPGVLYLIGRNSKPEQLPDGEVEALRTVLACRNACPAVFLHPGARVRFSQGPFAGLQGTVLRSKGQFRVVISIEAIMKSILVDVDRRDLESACEALPFSSPGF